MLWSILPFVSALKTKILDHLPCSLLAGITNGNGFSSGICALSINACTRVITLVCISVRAIMSHVKVLLFPVKMSSKIIYIKWLNFLGSRCHWNDISQQSNNPSILNKAWTELVVSIKIIFLCAISNIPESYRKGMRNSNPKK